MNISGTCKGCTFVNDRCLLPDPVHCNRYIECVRQGPANRVFTRECALGSFFDRKSFLCVDPKNADCPTGMLCLIFKAYSPTEQLTVKGVIDSLSVSAEYTLPFTK